MYERGVIQKDTSAYYHHINFLSLPKRTRPIRAAILLLYFHYKSKMDTKDQGHRFGNFPNYYAFHPPANRLEVLEKTNILSYIRQRLLFLDGVDKDNDDCDGTLAAAIANKEGKVSNKVEPATKKLRIEEKTRLSARLNAKVHGDGTIIYYCDLIIL